MNNPRELVPDIERVQKQVREVSSIERRKQSDISSFLLKAADAAAEADTAWMLEELQSAADALRPYQHDLAARALAEQIMALIQRASGGAAQQPTQSHNQTIGGNARVDVAVSGNVHDGIQTGVVNYGSGNTISHTGDVVGGDKIGGDKVQGDKHTYNNTGSNQGAQGVFHGPVTFNQGGSGKTEAPHTGDSGPRDIKLRRLRTLEMQAARYGSDTPPHIAIEIEDLRAELGES